MYVPRKTLGLYTLGHLSCISVTLILAKQVFVKTFCDASVLVFPFRRLIRLHSLYLYRTHEAKAVLQYEIKAKHKLVPNMQIYMSSKYTTTF